MRIIADRKVQDLANAVVGANEDGYHLTGNVKAALRWYVDIREVRGEISPDSQGIAILLVVLRLNIFKLGTHFL